MNSILYFYPIGYPFWSFLFPSVNTYFDLVSFLSAWSISFNIFIIRVFYYTNYCVNENLFFYTHFLKYRIFALQFLFQLVFEIVLFLKKYLPLSLFVFSCTYFLKIIFFFNLLKHGDIEQKFPCTVCTWFPLSFISYHYYGTFITFIELK